MQEIDSVGVSNLSRTGWCPAEAKIWLAFAPPLLSCGSFA